MNILLLGKNGQVGWELQRALAPLGNVAAFDFPEVDFENPDSLRQCVNAHKPHIIVNAAAYTAVDKAEADAERAKKINTDAVALLAGEAKKLDARLIHYSTDYVYDGNKNGAYVETDKTAPMSVYGLTKRDGDVAIQSTECRHWIFRTSWVFGAHGHNFIKTMLRLARERDELRVVSDQIGAPTGAELIADITAMAIYRDMLGGNKTIESGVYHLASSGKTSWHGFAQHVIAEAMRMGVSLKTTPDRIMTIATQDYPLPAKRPANSQLDTGRLEKAFGLRLPDWQEQVTRVLYELVEGN